MLRLPPLACHVYHLGEPGVYALSQDMLCVSLLDSHLANQDILMQSPLCRDASCPPAPLAMGTHVKVGVLVTPRQCQPPWWQGFLSLALGLFS